MRVKSILIISMLCFAIFISAGGAQAQPPQNQEDQGEKVQQKITTPPLTLSEEEERRTQQQESGKVEFEPVPLKTKSKIELILDASGSMNGLMGTATKMDLLKSAANTVVSQPLPEGAERELGLRTYGGRKPSEDANCTDTELLVPIEPFDKGEFQSKIKSINAMGVTPIGLALEKAAADFATSDEADNVIILVTDGADSCNADLCQIAKDLHAGPKKIMVNVIGFDLDQTATAALECVAKNADGQFLKARNENELVSTLDQLLMANIPYNLRLKILSGASPLPASLKVFRSGTKMLVREDETTGIKYYQLSPGTYDIEITYKDSLEKPPPSKFIKGVEVQATSKAEQMIQFDLGMLTLSAFDQAGEPIAATYILRKSDDPKVMASFKSHAVPYSAWLTAGSYNARVQAVTPEGLKLNASADNLEVAKGGSMTHEFQFQVGKIKLSGKDSKGEPLSIFYNISPAGDDGKKIILDGTAPPEGKTIELPPGKYKISVSLNIEGLKDLPSIELDEIEINKGDLLEEAVEMPTATISLVGKDSEGKLTETLFSIKATGSTAEPAQFTFTKEPIVLMLSPGRYDIKALFVNSDFEPKPLINWEAVPLINDQLLEKEAIFKFGELRLYGQNAKGAPIESAFFIYNVGEDEPLITLGNILSPTPLKLTEGFYNVKAEDLSARSDPKPNVWFHNTEVKLDKPASINAVFTNGLLKMICKGPNNVKLDCDYKVFSYGTDSPLFEGTTIEHWLEFDISPGNYYVEAGYHDAKDEVLLKKWITFHVEDNEIVEQVIRF